MNCQWAPLKCHRSLTLAVMEDTCLVTDKRPELFAWTPDASHLTSCGCKNGSQSIVQAAGGMVLTWR